jgi:hypothetical protein
MNLQNVLEMPSLRSTSYDELSDPFNDLKIVAQSLTGVPSALVK